MKEILLNDVEKKIEETKSKLLKENSNEQDKILYYTLSGLLELKSFLKVNNSTVNYVLNKFKYNLSPKELKDFYQKNNLRYKYFDDKALKDFNYYDCLDDFYNISQLEDKKVKNIKISNFTFEETVNLNKDFYKSINNLKITEKALKILNEGNLKFVKRSPKGYTSYGGIFIVPNYILINTNNKITNFSYVLTHEVGHNLDYMLSPENFLNYKSTSEWIPTALEFLHLDYLYEQEKISQEEYETTKSNRLYLIKDLIKNTLINNEEYGIDDSYLLKSQSLLNGYGLYKKAKEKENINGDLLYNCFIDKHSYKDFLVENRNFIIEEFKKDYTKSSHKTLVK